MRAQRIRRVSGDTLIPGGCVRYRGARNLGHKSRTFPGPVNRSATLCAGLACTRIKAACGGGFIFEGPVPSQRDEAFFLPSSCHRVPNTRRAVFIRSSPSLVSSTRVYFETEMRHVNTRMHSICTGSFFNRSRDQRSRGFRRESLSGDLQFARPCRLSDSYKRARLLPHIGQITAVWRDRWLPVRFLFLAYQQSIVLTVRRN